MLITTYLKVPFFAPCIITLACCCPLYDVYKRFRRVCCCCRFELALQQNEILDVFYDDYLSLADDETTFGAKSDNYLKVMYKLYIHHESLNKTNKKLQFYLLENSCTTKIFTTVFSS